MPILRRDAVLAAAITVGLARRAGDPDALRSTWHRVAPVVAGTDVELLLLDAWGELSAGAAMVSPTERDTVVRAMADAITRAGTPAWCVAVDEWWRLQRAIATKDTTAAAPTATTAATAAATTVTTAATATATAAATEAAAAAARLTALVDGDGAGEPVGRLTRPRATAARAWVSVFDATIDPRSVMAAAAALTAAGQPWEAAALCGAAAAKLTGHPEARELLAAGRAFRARIATRDRSAAGGLSERERAVGALLVDGLTHKEIGARLYLSPKTVEQHVARLRQKLLVTHRSELLTALRARLGT